MALWELEELQGPTFLGFVRSIPTPEEFRGAEWLPNKTISTLDYEYVMGAGGKRAVMAHIMGWDSEAPLHGKRAPGPEQTVRGEIAPIKRKARISEKEIIKFVQPRPGTTDQQDVLDYVYDTTTELVDAVQARMEWLRMQALSEDQVLIDSEGVIVTVDFGVPTTQQYDVNTHGDLSTYWTDTTNSNPLLDLDFICNQFEAVHGFRPAGPIICDPTTRQLMLSNDNLRDMIRGIGAPTLRLTDEELNALLALYRIPPLADYSAQVLAENHDGTYTPVRPFNANKAVILPGNGREVGNLLLGPTAESRQIPGIAYTPFAPGIIGRVYGKDEPPAEFIKVAATAFPTLPGAQYICQLKIRNDL